jgi:hypothetical protein
VSLVRFPVLLLIVVALGIAVIPGARADDCADRARCGFCRLAVWLGILAALPAARTASAHESLAAFVHHHCVVVVGPRNIDVHARLEFYDSLSLRGRLHTSEGGETSHEHLGEHISAAAAELEGGFELVIDGSPVEVLPMYAPEVGQLRDRWAAGPLGHVLRLTYFARTPETLRADSRISVADRLWPNAPAICHFRVSGRDGVRVAPDESARQTSPAELGYRMLQARCVEVAEEPTPDGEQALRAPRSLFLTLTSALLSIADRLLGF